MPNTLTESSQHRFGGIARLYGTNALLTLQRSHVLIIGIGGVGSWTAEALARSGIGSLTLLDLDDICVTNTNRQVHANAATIGKSKIQVMAERLLSINPEITVNTIDDFLDEDNLNEYITTDYSLVIDAIDAVMVKTKLIHFCKRKKIPVITIGSAGGKKDPQLITQKDLSRTKNDPMLSKIRNNLRRLYGFSRDPKQSFSVAAVYSTEQMIYPDNNGETCYSKQYMDGSITLDCAQGFGAATMVTATFGFIAASTAIKKLTGSKK